MPRRWRLKARLAAPAEISALHDRRVCPVRRDQTWVAPGMNVGHLGEEPAQRPDRRPGRWLGSLDGHDAATDRGRVLEPTGASRPASISGTAAVEGSSATPRPERHEPSRRVHAVHLDDAVGRHVGLAQERLGHRVVVRGAVVEDERGVGQTRRGDGPLGHEGMLRPSRQQEPLLVERRDPQARVARGPRLADQPELGAAEGDELDDPVGRARVHVEMHARVEAPETRHELRHDRGVDGRCGRDDELTLVALLDLVDGGAAGLDGIEGPLGVRQQRLPGQRQPHAALGALEEPCADLDPRGWRSGR